FYKDLYRECCPHAISIKNGREQVFMFQFAGESSEGLPLGGQWKCMHVDLISAVKVQDGPWYTDDKSKYSRTATCIDHLDFDILSAFDSRESASQTAVSIVSS